MSKKIIAIALAVISFTAIRCKNNDRTTRDKKEIVYSDALKERLELLKLHPDSSGLRLKIAMGLDSANDFPHALAQMDSLIKSDSANYGFIFTKGQIYQDAGDTAHAIQSYEKAMRVYPAPEGLLALANLYAEKKDPRALQLASQVRALHLGNQDNANCDFIIGVYYARIKDVPNALKFLNQSLGEDYQNMPVHIEKGLVYFDQKNYRQALETFRFASTVNHLYPDAYYYMGRSYEMMGQKDSAAMRFKQALNLDKSFIEAQQGLDRINGK